MLDALTTNTMPEKKRKPQQNACGLAHSAEILSSCNNKINQQMLKIPADMQLLVGRQGCVAVISTVSSLVTRNS